MAKSKAEKVVRPARKRTTMRMRIDLLEQMDTAAAKADMNRTEFVEQVVAQHLRRDGYAVTVKPRL
jgi:metal-responsive CopG/Arc/MetJ family transcriptional regulator